MTEIKNSKDMKAWIAEHAPLPFDLGVKATAVLQGIRGIETLRRRRKTVDARAMRIFSENAAAFTKARESLIASHQDREKA